MRKLKRIVEPSPIEGFFQGETDAQAPWQTHCKIRRRAHAAVHVHIALRRTRERRREGSGPRRLPLLVPSLDLLIIAVLHSESKKIDTWLQLATVSTVFTFHEVCAACLTAPPWSSRPPHRDRDVHFAMVRGRSRHPQNEFACIWLPPRRSLNCMTSMIPLYLRFAFQMVRSSRFSSHPSLRCARTALLCRGRVLRVCSHATRFLADECLPQGLLELLLAGRTLPQ